MIVQHTKFYLLLQLPSQRVRNGKRRTDALGHWTPAARQLVSTAGTTGRRSTRTTRLHPGRAPTVLGGRFVRGRALVCL